MVDNTRYELIDKHRDIMRLWCCHVRQEEVRTINTRYVINQMARKFAIHAAITTIVTVV